MKKYKIQFVNKQNGPVNHVIDEDLLSWSALSHIESTLKDCDIKCDYETHANRIVYATKDSILEFYTIIPENIIDLFNKCGIDKIKFVEVKDENQ